MRGSQVQVGLCCVAASDRIQRIWLEPDDQSDMIQRIKSEEQPIRDVIPFIAVEYGVRAYGCKPMESSLTYQQ